MSPIRTSFAVIAALVVVLTGVSLARTNHAAVNDAPARSVFYHPGGIIMLNEFYVPPDEEIVFTGPVDLRSLGPIVVDGMVRGAAMKSADEEPYKMQFSSMTGIVIRGELICYPGYDGKEFGEDGGRGGDLVLRAPMLVGATEVKAGRGGNGAVGGGNGGRGGTLTTYGAAVVLPETERAKEHLARQRQLQREHGLRPRGTYNGSWLTGGHGGLGGPGDGGRAGGDGGGGGRGTGRHFVEADWMIEYRSLYFMDEEESAAALERSKAEFASGVIQPRFEPIPASEYEPPAPPPSPDSQM